MSSVELFEFHESIFGLSKVNVLTSGYCKKSILVHADLCPTISRGHS